MLYKEDVSINQVAGIVVCSLTRFNIFLILTKNFNSIFLIYVSMSRQAYIRKDISITEIRNVKRDLQKFVDLYDKITFIEDLYSGETVKYSIEKRGKTPQTGYKWLKSWNEFGIDGLFR